VPYFLLPGNHDEPEALRRVYSDHTYLFESSPHVSYALDAGAVRLLAVDSTKPGRPGGYLDAARLSWLQTQLRIDSQRPVLLALHHPPFAAGVWPLDWLGYINVHELARLVRAHPQIRRIVGGHVHCARAAVWAGTYACTSPSIKPQRLLLCERWRAPVLRFEEPGFLLHSFEGDGEVRTSVHRVNGTIEELHVNADVMPR
jgi:3',5'-cyclic AMP phosphodiesterase CpdA